MTSCDHKAFSLSCPAAMQLYWNKRKLLHKKGSFPTGLFWDMTDVTSCENVLLTIWPPVLCRIALWGCFGGCVLTQFPTQVKEVTASPTETHSAIRHHTDPVSAHAQAQNRPRPLALSSPEPVVSWSRGLRFILSRVALGTRMVPWVLEREPWERGCLGMAKTKSKKGDDYL